jgi:colanic acid/amylovoran biosynthesis glycosyltransferase
MSAEPMRITFCAYDSPTYLGGPNAWLRRLLPELQQRGFAPEVLFFYWGEGPGATEQALVAEGIYCRSRSMPLYTEDRIGWLLARLNERRPAVFVPNLMVAAYYAGRWARAAGIPTVGVLHSDDAFHRGLVRQFVVGPEADQLAALVCVSQFLAEEVCQQQPEHTLVRRIPYGISPALRHATAPIAQLRLIYAGRLVEQQKRISETTAALCHAVAMVPGVEARLYGDGPARPAVEAIINTHGQGLPISLIGRVDSEQMRHEFAAGHGLVLLSDYEGLPIVLLEAMAAGLVPICTPMRSGIDELVEDGVSGLIVADRGEGFVAAVRRLREEPGLWERLSTGAKARVAGYSQARAADAWAALLQQLAGSATPSQHPFGPRGQIILPPVDPDLAREDLRRPALPYRLLQRGRQFARQLRQRLTSKRNR